MTNNNDDTDNEVIVLRHNPDRRNPEVLTFRHRDNRSNRSDNAVIQMRHAGGSMHTRVLRQQGITGIVEDVPEFCPNHCMNRCREITVNGEPRWECPNCGIVF